MEGDEAIQRSQELTKLQGVKKALLWPYLGLILVARLVWLPHASSCRGLLARGWTSTGSTYGGSLAC